MGTKVAVVGLGNMGAGIAERLADKGFDVLGVDGAPAAAERVGNRIRLVRLAEALDAATVLVLSLPGSAVVEEVLAGDGGLLASGVAPRVVVDTSTSDPTSTRRLAAALDAAGHRLVDAPVSGGPGGARDGGLTVFLGGDDDAVAAAEPVLQAISRQVTHVGGPGAGNVAKLVNNLLCATHLQIAGEALRLVTAEGLDPHRVVAAVNAASGRSAVTETNLPRWVLPGTFDSGFTVGLMARDVQLAARTAAAAGVDLPMTADVARTWAAARDAWGPGEDFNRVADPAAPSLGGAHHD